jgi:hypothetical protein
MLQIELPRRHGTSLAVSRLAHESSRITPPGRAPGQPSDFTTLKINGCEPAPPPKGVECRLGSSIIKTASPTTLKIESLSDVSWEG